MTFLRAIILTALVAATNPADARIVTVIYSGILAGAQDDSGLFGAPNTILTGLPYRAVYRFDTEKPGAMRTITATGDAITGMGATTPLLDASLTINGRSVAVSGELRSSRSVATSATASNMADLALAFYSIGSVIYNRQLVDTIQTPAGVLPVSIDTPFTYTVTENDMASGGFFFSATDVLKNKIIESARGSYVAKFIEVQVDGIANPGVPEPASWSMLVVGFGFVGSVVRRRAAVTTERRRARLV